jgi:hypothetical protein
VFRQPGAPTGTEDFQPIGKSPVALGVGPSPRLLEFASVVETFASPPVGEVAGPSPGERAPSVAELGSDAQAAMTPSTRHVPHHENIELFLQPSTALSLPHPRLRISEAA